MGFLIKWSVALTLIVGGTIFLAQGLGIDTFLRRYEEKESSNLPVGGVLLGAGFGLAAFWKFDPHGRYYDPDDISSRNRKVIKVERRGEELK